MFRSPLLVLVGHIPARAVVVVKPLTASVVGDDEVVVDVRQGSLVTRIALAVLDVGQVGLAVPTVEGEGERERERERERGGERERESGGERERWRERERESERAGRGAISILCTQAALLAVSSLPVEGAVVAALPALVED
jgi:hypothetical protein